MTIMLNDESYYFNAFIKTVQFLATLTTHKNIMDVLEKLIKKFYNCDFYASYECGADGPIIEHLNNFSNNRFSKIGLEKIEETIVQVLESGFFASELINTPDPYSMAFLPISKANEIVNVIVVGHRYSETLPKYLLNIYLALAGFVGTTIEKLTMIQELRIQHNKLKENDRFLTNIFASIQDGICIIDKGFNIIRVNPTMENWYSHMKPLSEKKCYHVLKQKTERCKECALEKLFETNEPIAEVISRKGKHGEILGSLEIYTFPLHDQETGKIKGAIEYIRDITERSKTERKLKESEEKYALILKNANDLIAILNDNFQYEYVNEGVLMQLLQISTEEIIGKIPLDLIHPDDSIIASISMKKCLESGECMVELRFIKKDGSSIWLENKGKTFFNETGERKVLIISRDITKRKKAEKMIKKEIEKLKEIDQIRKDIITRTSHELKTPLVSICSSAELLLNIHKKHYDDKAKEFIEIIDRGGKRLLNLVDTMLDITILESGKLELKKRKENLVEIIKESVDHTRNLAINREISLNTDLPKELYLEVDKTRIEQVIINILTNAIKNTFHKGTIYVSLQENDVNIYISIKDTGIGLIERERSRLFKKFGKIERYGKKLDVDIDGSGLGLYISKEIVNLHNGQIWAESEGRNKGSTFIVKLPIK